MCALIYFPFVLQDSTCCEITHTVPVLALDF